MAREQLQHLRQGEKTVSDYSNEFRRLPARVPEWTEVNRVHAFRDGLRRDLLLQCLGQAHPAMLTGWIRLAGEIEGRLKIVKMLDVRDAAERTQVSASKATKKGDQRKAGGIRSPSFAAGGKVQWRWEKGLSLGCGGEGHFLADCPSKKVKYPTS